MAVADIMLNIMPESKKWLMKRNGHKPRSLKCSTIASSSTRNGRSGNVSRSQTNKPFSVSTTKLRKSTASVRERNRRKI